MFFIYIDNYQKKEIYYWIEIGIMDVMQVEIVNFNKVCYMSSVRTYWDIHIFEVNHNDFILDDIIIANNPK